MSEEQASKSALDAETADELANLATDFASADHATALTGAGLSTASGVPDFRSEGGIWDRFDPDDFRYERFLSDPTGFWTDRTDLHELLYGVDVAPNAGHDALAALERSGHLDALLTQNVDGLHAEAGSESLIRLHGTSAEVECSDCGQREPAGPVHERAAAGERPPRCTNCDGVLKPAVVLFGEDLPGDAIHRAKAAVRETDFMLVAGTSLSVYPVAGLPGLAAETGATVAVLNRDRVSISGSAAYDLRTDVSKALPALAGRIQQHA